jgi:hypothetical protein
MLRKRQCCQHEHKYKCIPDDYGLPLHAYYYYYYYYYYDCNKYAIMWIINSNTDTLNFIYFVSCL